MQDWKTELEQKREAYRKEHNLPKIDNYGLAKSHHIKSKEIYDFISETDFANGDTFCFKKGGDGDNGEMLMDLLDAYFQRAETTNNTSIMEIKQAYE